MFEPYDVPAFGGGLNVAQQSRALRDDQWSWGDGFLAVAGAAETQRAYLTIASNWLAAGHVPIGIVQNPWSGLNGALVGSVHSTTRAIKLYTVSSVGTVTEITSDGVGTAAVGDPTGLLTAGFLNGFLILSFGMTAGSGKWGLVQYSGGATYTVINDTTATVTGSLSAMFLASFQGHLVAGGVNINSATVLQSIQRTIAWSDANNQLVWTPSVSNTADTTVLDDLTSGITGMGFISTSTLGLFTADGVHGLTATADTPAFTRTIVTRLSVPPLVIDNTNGTIVSPGLFGPMGDGTVVKGADNLYSLAGGGQQIGSAIWPYLVSGELLGSASWNGPYVGHKRLGQFFVTRQGSVEADTAEILSYDPVYQAWSRRSLPFTPLRQAYLTDTTQVSGGIGVHWFIGSDFTIYGEAVFGTTSINAFVDTKDFSFDTPTVADYIDRISVQWEDLSGNAQLIVQAVTRNDYLRGQLGSPGYETQLIGQFISYGTLTLGQSELPLRLQGKYVRFRFRQAAGRLRIRGFTIRRERGGDRPSR